MRENGFTLIELVIILVLIGILAVFAAPRMLDVTSTNAAAFADKLRADIRYAQNAAMTSSRRSRIYFNGTATPPFIAPNPGYAAGIDNPPGSCTTFAFLADPALTGNLSVALNAGDYAGVTVAPDFGCLEYDSLGRPYDCSANLGICAPAASALAGVMNIVVNANGNLVTTVTVAAQTGAVN